MTESNNLDGVTVDGKPLNNFLQKEESKVTKSVYDMEILEKKDRNPNRVKPIYKSRKERNGKVKKLTPEEYYNREPIGNFDNCINIKEVVISLLLTGKKFTSKKLYLEIKTISQINNHIGCLFKEEKLDLDKMYSIMHRLCKSLFGTEIIKAESKTMSKYKRHINTYQLSKNALSFTLEKAIILSKKYQKGLSKTTIKKAVKKVKLYSREEKTKSFGLTTSQNEHRIKEDIINIISKAAVNKEDFETHIENLNSQIESLRELVNQLMIDTPAESLKKSFGIDKLEVEVKGGVDVNFRFLM